MKKLDLNKRAMKYSENAKMEIKLNASMKTKDDLSMAYTPGIAEVCKAIQKDEEVMFSHTFRKNNLAIISEGSAVLGLGNIGHKASYPVMEGKSMLFKRFANIDAVPIIVKSQDVDTFVNTVLQIADSFGAINIEDISAPRCFEIEKRLVEALDIPLMHDDQHGTAIVVLAGLINALKLLPKKDKKTRIVVNGAGAAGVAIVKLLVRYGFKDVMMCDSKGIIGKHRKDLNSIKHEMSKITNCNNFSGSLQVALKNADVFIGVSRSNLLTEKDIKLMSVKPIIFAMANPVPEIMPDLAMKAGAGIVGSGRSDFANQVNNALSFPGLFRGAMDMRVRITENLKLAAVEAIVEYHKKDLSLTNLMPSILDQGVHKFIAKKVREEAQS